MHRTEEGKRRINRDYFTNKMAKKIGLNANQKLYSK